MHNSKKRLSSSIKYKSIQWPLNTYTITCRVIKLEKNAVFSCFLLSRLSYLLVVLVLMCPVISNCQCKDLLQIEEIDGIAGLDENKGSFKWESGNFQDFYGFGTFSYFNTLMETFSGISASRSIRTSTSNIHIFGLATHNGETAIWECNCNNYTLSEGTSEGTWRKINQSDLFINFKSKTDEGNVIVIVDESLRISWPANACKPDDNGKWQSGHINSYNLKLGAGNDVLLANTSGNSWLHVSGGSGNDYIELNSKSAENSLQSFVYGGKGDDVIVLDDGGVSVFGGAGKDKIFSASGNCVDLDCGTDEDFIFGEVIPSLVRNCERFFGERPKVSDFRDLNQLMKWTRYFNERSSSGYVPVGGNSNTTDDTPSFTYNCIRTSFTNSVFSFELENFPPNSVVIIDPEITGLTGTQGTAFCSVGLHPDDKEKRIIVDENGKYKGELNFRFRCDRGCSIGLDISSGTLYIDKKSDIINYCKCSE